MSPSVYSTLDIIGNRTFKSKPELCPFCSSSSVEDVEVIGAYTGTLLWQCRECGEFLLRFPKETTKEYLNKLKDLFVDIDEEKLEELWHQPPN